MANDIKDTKWVQDYDKRIASYDTRIAAQYKFIELDIKNEQFRRVKDRVDKIQELTKYHDAAVHQRQGFLLAVKVIERDTGIQYVG